MYYLVHKACCKSKVATKNKFRKPVKKNGRKVG